MISIIVPVYNAQNYLSGCIESLLAQTEKDLQIILVDDESTDESPAIAHDYAARDPRILVLQQPHAGQSVARNLALLHAKGEFIAFVDADDRIEPDWCKQHLTAIHNVDYVQSGYKRVTNDTRLSAIDHLPSTNHQFTSPCMRLYRRKTIEGLRFAEGYIYEDVLFSTDLWLRNVRCKRIPYAGYLYTLNPQGTTSRPHPEDRKRLDAALRAKREAASLCGRLIIDYTILRLKIHFLRS